eukprot:2260820-Rhodomonas_salina.1
MPGTQIACSATSLRACYGMPRTQHRHCISLRTLHALRSPAVHNAGVDLHPRGLVAWEDSRLCAVVSRGRPCRVESRRPGALISASDTPCPLQP